MPGKVSSGFVPRDATNKRTRRTLNSTAHVAAIWSWAFCGSSGRGHVVCEVSVMGAATFSVKKAFLDLETGSKKLLQVGFGVLLIFTVQVFPPFRVHPSSQMTSSRVHFHGF